MGKYRTGFTLLEVLIVIALIGAILTLSVINFSIIPNDGMKTPQGFLAEGLKRARIDSQALGAGVSLFYDEEGRDLIARISESGAEIWRINMLGDKPIKEGEEDKRTEYEKLLRKKIELKFYPRFPDVINFASVSSFSEMEISAMSFYPDSASTPVRIVLKIEGEDAIERILDPFSGYAFPMDSQKKRAR